ncbi:hypothetical protein IEQ34_011173 [Dendrobium chrysotoxum]|uniref:RRM domain-containing protein n=1 Tax=Dendrobium chrysotoxum TaxID=161865 RepID=A0AAV7GWR7_DENCH|nr:hypothetical protein IEQ34_011173 [Dendrobium chrysotoxum]
MAKALAVARAGFRRFFSISAFTPPPPATVPPPAEPSPNLFVSGKWTRWVGHVGRGLAVGVEVSGRDVKWPAAWGAMEGRIVYDEHGFVHILHSTFFDINSRIDNTVEEYVERILDTLVEAIEEQLGNVQWHVVSGLSKRTTSEGLREAFSKFGNVVHARVVTDRVSGYSKGFGFVRYGTIEEAAEGIKGDVGSENFVRYGFVRLARMTAFTVVYRQFIVQIKSFVVQNSVQVFCVSNEILAASRRLSRLGEISGVWGPPLR